MPEETIPSTDAAKKFESGKSHVLHAAEDLKAAAEAKAQELRSVAEAKAKELRGKAEQTFDDAKAKAQEFRATAGVKAQEFRGKAEHAYGEARVRARGLREEGEEYIRENPMQTVLAALGIGFLLGLIFRR